MEKFGRGYITKYVLVHLQNIHLTHREFPAL